jgi:hypothetical protein
MKRFIYTAILIFSFLLTNISAQTTNDAILVNGNPALTQTMIDKSREVFEFAFGGTFTEAEKDYFRGRLMMAWREKDTGTMKAIQDFVSFHEKANGLNREQLLKLQKELRESLIKELRGQVDKDELAQVLVNIYNRLQGLNAKQGGNLPVPADVPKPAQTSDSEAIPRELLGEWVESKNVTQPEWVGSNGSYSTPNGEKIVMHFFPDGTYKGLYHVQSSMSMGCTMIVDIFSEGTYNVGTNVLNLSEKSNQTISRDSCVARYNYDRNNTPRNYAYPAYIEPNENGTRLVLTMNDGKHYYYLNKGQNFLAK